VRQWLYQDVREKVEADLDLEEEVFIEPNEMLGYCNEAIDEAEAEIHKLHEDYFLTNSDITLVNGQSEYDLPTDIYAQKIRGVIYKNGSLVYPIQRVRNLYRFEDIAQSEIFGKAEFYRYYILNPSASDGYKLVLLPESREDGDFVKIWYLRNANRVEDDTSVIDIPEFANFIIQFMKVRILEKEGNPNLPTAIQILQQQRQMMVDTLTQMIVDDDDQVEGDFSHYQEHS
jgi:hypothetical protein